ncbi:malto-oligosyltrehalose trehalohydrolase [Mangrovicoccus sp. HB182678]|uniref:Malto-oligosyltrehalose trehalohydrolase n=2 Tax=Mangrovicoccus algicola TaxID=2771008 RepID=A0A8J7CIR4_9RHOB|nr:malto-oligosyltrehalose trehalohydrolase [Mangrovicoccus algicola]
MPDPVPQAAPLRSWGVHPAGAGRWQAALWAPGRSTCDIVVAGRRHRMDAGGDGVFRAEFEAEDGAEYGFDLGEGLRPDPAARAQAGDVHGPSRLVADRFDWPASEAEWQGRPWSEAVILEIHVGLFTPEGTFRAAIARLPGLAAMGVTAIEIMPVAQFSGGRGWGYDGVLPFAPHNAYGTPGDLKALVAAAHAEGIAVILDVVYNHFGPDGAYLHEIAPEFFDPGRATPWGAGIDYSRPAVREFFLSNVAMWIGEYRFDGLRIDAAHQIRDAGRPAMLEEIARTARAAGAGRAIWLVLEDERNLAGPVAPGAGLYDAQWNDDFHHALHCLLTGEDESYYAPFAVDPMADLVRALGEGQVDQGQPRPPMTEPRGEPSGHLPPLCFVNSCQTHDQVGNRARGERLIALAGEAAARTCHALLLLSPFVPMLFMGEEAGEEAPFCFFADFPEPMAEATRKGRQKEFERFAGFRGQVPDPISPATFEMSRPYRGDPGRIADWNALTARLLAYRASRIVPLLAEAGPVAQAARITPLGPRALEAQWRFPGGCLAIRLSLGGAPAGIGADGWDMEFGDIARDAFALAVRVTQGEEQP